MNIKVINISKDLEPILGVLYPTYSINESEMAVRNFIRHKEVTSKSQREALDVYYDDGIFISTQIFDEFWDEEKVKQEVVEFGRKVLHSRKKTIPDVADNLLDNCKSFLFDLSSEEDEKSITELFDLFGSQRFPQKFMELTKTIPVPVLTSAMSTFVTKILSDSSSLYYKKKAMLYGDKIRANFIKALDTYNLIQKDSYGFSTVRFYMDLVS